MSIRKHRCLWLLLSCLVGTTSTAMAAQEVVIYIGTDEYPPQNLSAASAAGVTLGVYNLDAQHKLEARLTQNLPADQASAQRIVGERFAALTGDEVQAIFRPVALVAQWDIRKAPAIVFDDGATVIYGVTDVGQALNYWRTWHQRTRHSIERRP